MWILRWFASRTLRQTVDAVRHVGKLLNAQRDQLPPEAIQAVQRSRAEVWELIRQGASTKTLQSGVAKLEEVINRRLRPYPHARMREHVEVFLVTIAVVMALRTFFFQPMAIPSGSAQPTLLGITYQDLRNQPEIRTPRGLAWLGRALWAGEKYYDVKTDRGGVLTQVAPPRHIFFFIKIQTFRVGDERHTLWMVPENVFDRKNGPWVPELGQTFAPGEDVLRVKAASGDHLFVNRMVYNFRRPRRGEIVVFTSHGLEHLRLIQDTHYIKRLIALGGEKVRIGNDRHVVIDGVRLDSTYPGFENVYSFDPDEPPRRDRYSGHVNDVVARKSPDYPGQSIASKFPNEQAVFTVRPNHYLAFGDNTMNSHDGRQWGDFPRDKVVGRAGFVFWPISSRFGWGYR